MRQALKYVAQPLIRLLVVEFGSFDQAVDLRTGCGAFRRVAEQQAFLPMANGLIALSAALLSMGKKPVSI